MVYKLNPNLISSFIKVTFLPLLFYIMPQTGIAQSPTTTGFVTDYGGFWQTSVEQVNTVRPDNSHHLLAFTYNGLTYSTGVNNSILTNHSVNFTPSVFKALPVAAISGITTTSGSRFLAAGALVDGSPTGYVAGVARFTIKEALIDGIHGLDMGTGITNLPPTAHMTFQIYNIDGQKIADAEPDLVLTQIADPASANDEFTLVDAAGNTVGTPFTQNMTFLPELGRYTLDLFSFPAGIPYNTARPNGILPANTNTTRPLRLVALRLADFGITASDASLVKALRITPSGNSDYAFIAYNANAINLPPNAALSPETSVSSVCAGGTASLEIVGTPAANGILSYTWEESNNGGSSWHPVNNGGNISGATTNRLTIANAIAGYLYRSSVHETDNGNAGISGVFTITDASSLSTLPTNVSIAGGGAVCASATHQFLADVTGGSNLVYQWQKRTDTNPFENIPGANTANYIPVTTESGATNYRLQVSNGSGCPRLSSNTITMSVEGITAVAPAQRCQPGQVTLSATTSSGSIHWYNAPSGGTLQHTGASFSPTISQTTTYYVQSNSCVDRVPVIATIYPSSAVGAVNSSPGYTPGTTLLTISGQTGQVLRWQSSTDNFIANVADIAHTQSQLVVDNAFTNTVYRAVVQSGNCAPVYSNIAAVLPFRPNSLKLHQKEQAVVLEWQTYDQQRVTTYEIQRSKDGIQFESMGSMSPHASHQYEWTDPSPGTGRIFYRIKEISMDGEFVYSNINFITIHSKGWSVTAYPNPIVGNTIQIQLSGNQKESYTVRLYNTTGQSLLYGRLNSINGSTLHQLNPTSKLPPGIYQLLVTRTSGESQVLRILVSNP